MTPEPHTLPRVFAVQERGSRAHTVYLFDSHRIRDGGWAGGSDGLDEYEISPHEVSPYQPAVVGPDRESRLPRAQRIRIRVEDWHRRPYSDFHYHTDRTTTWRPTGGAVYTLSSQTPVPIIDIDCVLPCTERNRLHAPPARRQDLRQWWEHWHPGRSNRFRPDSDEEEEDSEEERERERRRQRRRQQRAAVAAPAPAPPAPVALAPPPIPKFVAEALIRDAITRAATCPITMEPLKSDTTAVTACFHLFERDAIAVWLAQSGDCCAVCKQRTTVAVV